MKPITKEEFARFLRELEAESLKPRKPLEIMVHPEDYEFMKRFFAGLS